MIKLLKIFINNSKKKKKITVLSQLWCPAAKEKRKKNGGWIFAFYCPPSSSAQLIAAVPSNSNRQPQSVSYKRVPRGANPQSVFEDASNSPTGSEQSKHEASAPIPVDRESKIRRTIPFSQTCMINLILGSNNSPANSTSTILNFVLGI